MKKLLLLLLATGILFSCQPEYKSFTVSGLNFFSNTKVPADSLLKLPLDLDSVILNGVLIPSAKQTHNGYFNFSFRLKNTSDKLQRFFFKVFYQNETYKFNEEHVYANENFYGSWEEPEHTFKPTKSLGPGEEIIITDSFRIVGNPRNEKRFYGADLNKHQVNKESINNTIAYIKRQPEWVKQIHENAVANKISLDAQFYIDALWSLNEQLNHDSTNNNRWKRNPRVGTYEFMLVVSSQDGLSAFPESFKDITKPDRYGSYTNPFGYVKQNAIDRSPDSRVLRSNKKLLVNAKLDLSKGIYVNSLSLGESQFDRSYFNASCGDSLDKYSKAHMELFIHNINKDYVLHNVNEVRDVVGENMIRADYQKYATQYKGAQLVDTYVNATDCPCKNISVNKEENSITLRNPGNQPGTRLKKEHVGVISRVGFTYGKFRAKIKFPEIMSRDHVWNGITNAFWLMAQDVNASWNMRRICDAGVGYIPKKEPDVKASLRNSKKQIPYSEIDFEILKESEFWPRSSYFYSNEQYQKDSCARTDDVMVTCTNWDMACHQPEAFNIGAVAHSIDGAKYIHHRWNSWYKALTTKVPAKHDDLFKAPYYYFEIEWSPEKIVWRIGPEKDQMRVICIMDKNVSAIPNNQMLMIITQEWHNQEWWPTAPYKQNFIPFPKNDIVGKVLELEIE